MSRHCRTLASAFERDVQTLNHTRRHVDRLLASGQLPRRAAEAIYEGLLVNAFTGFEGLIEDLFVGLLVAERGLVSSRKDVTPRVAFKAHAVAREVVMGGRPYVDWLPYERTKGRAALFFRGSRPFVNLGKADIAVVHQIHAIRNVIAHRSRASWARYEADVIKTLPLTPRERPPGGFLRSAFAHNPIQTRLEFYAASLVHFGHRLAQ